MDQSGLLYRRIVRNGRKLLSELVRIERVRSALKVKGMSKGEIKTAISLMSCIIYLDYLVFPNNRIWDCAFVYVKPDQSIAGYNHPSYGQYPTEKYFVIVKDILEEFKVRNRIILYGRGEEEWSYNDLPFQSYQQLMISVAAHEIRHRFQCNSNMRMFFADDLYDDVQINRYVFYTKKRFERGDYSEVEDSALRAAEFDARVVEKLVLFVLNDGADETRVRDTIRIEGNNIERVDF